MEQVEPRKFSRASREKDAIRTETTADGRYIPYSGGIMGWLENSGVMKKELPNNYRFHTMIDAGAVRRKLFERWGDGEKVNRRVATRHDLESQIEVTLVWGERTEAASTRDFSTHGLRLQLHVEGERPLEPQPVKAIPNGSRGRAPSIYDKPILGVMSYLATQFQQNKI